MSQRFESLPFDDESIRLRQKFLDLFASIEVMMTRLPNTRHSQLALTKLEESHMWLGKAIRDAQLARSNPTQ